MVKLGRIIFVFSLMLCGCDPHRFTVQTEHSLDCRIYSDFHGVTHDLYGFTMQGDAVVGVASPSWTQYEIETFIKMKGDGFQLLLRPVAEESVRDSGLILTISSSVGLRLDSGGVLLESNPRYRPPIDSQFFVTIFNEESYLQVTIGCDTVLRRYTKQKESDDLVIHTLPNSELTVIAPQWKRLRFQKDGMNLVHQVKVQ
ncbi:MAG: hypothetical protein WCH46_07570 [bacterium]